MYIGWYKDGKSVEIGGRIKTDDVAQSTQLTRFLIFTYPTDSDPGLYQCLAYNSQEFVQASTDVTPATPQTEDLPMGELWEPNSPFELKVFSTKKGVSWTAIKLTIYTNLFRHIVCFSLPQTLKISSSHY